MATGISEKMGGPHIKDSLSPWTQTISLTLRHVCPYWTKSHNSRDSLMNHIQFHYRMVLVCPICGGCRSNQWRTVKGHIKKQRPHTLYKCGQIHQMMRKPHIEVKSSNAFEKSGKPKLLTSGKLLLQKPKKHTRVMMLECTRMTANRPNQSLNDLLAVPRTRRTAHHPRGSNLPMTTSMSTLV